MNKFVVALSLMALVQPALAICTIKQETLSADYAISRISHHPHGHAATETTTTLQLVRNGRTVAHRYPATQITESWYLTPQNTIKPTRYFDAHQRAIEYQPTETVHGKKETDWPYRYQLISQGLLDKMHKTSVTGEGCDTLEHFEYQDRAGKLTLAWLPELKLVKSFELTNTRTTERWSLTAMDADPEKVSALFRTLDGYQTTDYADIGDDHTDPFLTRMVTQGFVEQGASGFYDAHGNSLAGGHDH